MRRKASTALCSRRPGAACRPPGAGAFTITELLIVVAIIGLLVAIAVPALQRARGQSKLVVCGANLRQLGQGLVTYATERFDRLPLNVDSWETKYASTWAVEIRASQKDTWVVALQVALGWHAPPWLRGLACPLALERYPENGEIPVPPGAPGSAWVLNSYCSGRMLGSIPNPGAGVLAFEYGLWAKMSYDTGQLELPTTPWAYPHPAVRAEGTQVAWNWPYRGCRRNVLCCDTHVSTHAARQWASGDAAAAEADRVRHMRFNLPGSHGLDP